MSEEDMGKLLEARAVASWRISLARWVESGIIQRFILATILVNGVTLGLETSADIVSRAGNLLTIIDRICLAIFALELAIKMVAYRSLYWRNGWNLFDFFVVGVALVPNAGAWAVLRSLRVLRVLRLLTVVPQMRQVVAAFLHSIPGLIGVIAVMLIFFYTAGVLATNLFGESHPDWFGSLTGSLYTLFQIMTLESWSMGIVRPVMEEHPWAWAFFVPFIMVATFTILNLFIGIIVSTMQELATMPDPHIPDADLARIIERMESDMKDLRMHVEHRSRSS